MNVGAKKNRAYVMLDVKNIVTDINQKMSSTPNYLGFQQMDTTNNTVIHISALDAAKRLLVRPIIALVAAMNTSLGMAQHLNKFNA